MRNLYWSLAIVSVMLSCSSNEVIPPVPTPDPPPNQPVDTVIKGKDWVMTYVDSEKSSDNRSVQLLYDANRRLKTWKLINPETDFSVHYDDDTIHHVIFIRTDANGAYIGSSAIFLYTPDKRCYKVIYKKPLESYDVPYQDVMNESNPYYSQIQPGDIFVVDSLVYSATSQLTEIWQKRSQELLLHKFVYPDLQSKVPVRLQTYTSNDHVNLSLSQEIVFTTNEMDQPAYKSLWISAFISNLGTFSIPLTPIKPYSFSATKLALVSKCITKYTAYIYDSSTPSADESPEFTYFYNADSTSFTGRLVTPGVTDRFIYYFDKQ
ncbi:hypothetical protein [Chitinophaga rhizophila]|uniref:Uncharacterized protein n=1 Tax=Chitinophaga rhizophila TaxID=2866212 RepID=A0ABS7GAR8_9BACT|nr:hypothetical protein [Chitinophaga rhizophila]MBW8684757.1 hypothetical protein [Chitinophaga rhizophila]